jgi:soluble lytic murein transglycosylase-like protein
VEEYVRGREKGTTGLAQIMPEIWTDSRARYGLGPDPYNPHDNILAGAAHIRELHDRCGTPGFLAAYNADDATRTIWRLVDRQQVRPKIMSRHWCQ